MCIRDRHWGGRPRDWLAPARGRWRAPRGTLPPLASSAAWRCKDSPGCSAWWRHRGGRPRDWLAPAGGGWRAPRGTLPPLPSSAAWRGKDSPGCSAWWRHWGGRPRDWLAPARGRWRAPRGTLLRFLHPLRGAVKQRQVVQRHSDIGAVDLGIGLRQLAVGGERLAVRSSASFIRCVAL